MGATEQIAAGQAAFIAAAEAQGHVLRTEDGEVDTFAMSAEFHNGPVCVKCHASWCIHCHERGSIKPCVG